MLLFRALITDECINCDVCEPVCPNEAVFQGPEIFHIDPKKCTECVGHFDQPQCQVICLVDCIPQDENHMDKSCVQKQRFICAAQQHHYF